MLWRRGFALRIVTEFDERTGIAEMPVADRDNSRPRMLAHVGRADPGSHGPERQIGQAMHQRESSLTRFDEDYQGTDDEGRGREEQDAQPTMRRDRRQTRRHDRENSQQ